MPIGNMLQSLSKRNKIMYNSVLDFTGTEKHTKGSVTYFTAKIKDSNKDVTFSDTDKETLKGFLEFVESENAYVKEEHNKAKKGQVSSQDKEDEKLLKEVSA